MLTLLLLDPLARVASSHVNPVTVRPLGSGSPHVNLLLLDPLARGLPLLTLTLLLLDPLALVASPHFNSVIVRPLGSGCLCYC